MSDDLKPCPFCGKPAKKFGTNVIGCTDTVNCGANVDWGHYTAPTGPEDAWNKRTPTGEAAARIEELEKERDGLLTTWAESRERHLAAEAERDRLAALLREAEEALRAWIGAKDALHAFEAENPDNSGKAWQERFDELSAAEEDARALLARLEAREVSQ